MPLLGKIVVIKRNGGDGTEFPLTASCLFGRKLDCDIRIQLPQVSKEHCKIELNENKELILTNLSSVNPTCINGQVINQSERLKHGDVITIIDRSFRFEYPPPKTPKKKPSTPGKDKAVQALQKQQEKGTPVPVDKRKSEHSFDTCLKDGSNLPPSVEQTVETEPEECKLKKDSMSPFCELYQMVKQDLAAKSPWKSELPKTPLARPQVGPKVLAADVKSSPIPVPTSSTKRRRSSKTNSEDTAEPAIPQSSVNANVEEKTTEDMPPVGSGTPSLMEKNITPVSQKKRTPLTTPQKFSAGEVAQQILLDPQPEEKTPKSPKRRRSGGSQNQSPARQIPSVQPQTPASEEKITEVKMSPRTSPRTNAGKRFQVQNTETADTMSADKQGDTSVDEPSDGNKPHKKVSALKSKKKRVSFGGQLSPELFDKCLPPNSPLRRGATPRRSLGLSQKPQSLLRRASTIGLMALRLAENFSEAQKSSPKRASPKQRASPAKTPSPGRKSPSTKAKTPSPAKRSPSTKAKTPSPKPQKSPSATPRTPASAKRASTSAIESLAETPRVQGRFSVSRISTPSPVQDQKEKPEPQSTIVDDVSQKCVTPKIPLRRKSMKSSARKTPKSTIKSALDVMRSRRSGASRANLKVLTSWADIVKFGQIKPQTEVTTKKTTKSTIVRKTAVPKPKTPARRLKNDISTGHAASPVTIVVGKAHMRTNQSVGAAPKLVKNIALFKKDMKMDEDLTGVAEIFKTPANTRSKNRVSVNNECPEVPMDEISVMKTPEESGEMIVSPLSVVSTAKRGCYNNEAVTRLLLDKDGSLLEEGLSQFPQTSNEASYHYAIPDVETPSDVHMEEEEATPEAIVKTPKQKAAPSLCLTGVKRLMKTPKQKAEPIEDLRGKLLKTPKERKPSQNESLEGVKEILKTPKYRGAPVEDMVGVKRVMQTPKEKSNPVLCAAGLQRLMRTPKEKIEQQEDLTGVKELMKTPKIKAAIREKKLGLKRLMQTPKQKRTQGEEDLTGVQQLMKTPKHKGEQVEDQMGLQRLMQTPKEKVQHVEDLSGLKELMQTPKHKGDPISEISDLTKTPQLEAMAQDSTELKVIEPENSSSFTTEIGVTEPNETQESVENGSSSIPTEGLDEECDKENVCPVETMEIEVVQSVDVQCTAKEVESNQSDQDVETVIPQERHHEESVSVEATDVFSGAEEKTQELSEETVCVSDNTNTTVKATPASSTSEEEELIKSPPASKIQRGSRGRAAQKSKNEIAKAPAVLSLIEEEKQSSSIPASPTRGRRGKKLLEVPEVAASPLRKSARGRVPKHSFVEEEVKNTEASQVLAESVNTEIPDSLPVVTKTRKGRKAKQDDAVAVIVPTVDVNAVDPLCPEVSEEQVQAPVVKPGRRKKMDKVESQSSVELEQNPTEIVCEENAVASEDVITETVSATRARRGRPAKREPLRAEPTPALESEITSTHAVEVAEKPLTPVAKSGRGRKGKEIVKDQSLNDVTVSKTVSEADADNKEEPQTLVVKTGRGRKAKQQKPQMDEEVVDQPAVDTSAHLPVTEEHSETVVKSVRGNRKAKQSKVTISAEVEENIVSPVEQAETPVVRSGRKRGAIAKEPEMVADVSVKRGRRAVADPAPPVTVVSSRARKAAAKAEPEVTADVASLEEPVKPVKHTRRAAKAPESKKEENTMTQAESEQLQNTTVVTLEKVERSRRGKKTDSTKDIPKNPIKESATAEETDDMKLPKTVNWNPDLVACKDIETSTEVKEPQLKKPKRSGKLPAETVSKESNQAADLLPRGRRGRVAKEQEPLVEASQEEAHESIKPLRRGKAAAPSVTKSEATESKTTTPLKRKRNEVIEVADESISREPLPKRRGRVANSTEVAAEVSSKEKTSEAEPEKAEPAPKKTGSRAARGQKRTAQEPDPAPAKAQQSVTGTTTRKGRSVKKVEEAVVPAEAAPVRRTRRK